eukprot:INCI4076.2.p1 GENE.INCI4076.2~~INCI4076.2.p1  ORF type:complete len:372 (+),score=80.88 INCI4076.2:202-1317(+)
MHALKRLLAWAGIIDGDTPPPTEKALAENFKVFFENTYGTRAAAANGNGDENAAGAEDTATRRFSQCPNFEALSYLSALEKAKAEMKMLFVYLHGPHHFNSQAFCKNLCASAEALTFLQSQFLCWGASSTERDGYNMAIQLNVTDFPFVAVVCPGVPAAQVIFRASGTDAMVAPHELVARIQRAVSANQELVDNARAIQLQRDQDRMLTRQQDLDYAAAMAQDRERKAQERAARDAELATARAAQAQAEEERRITEEAARQKESKLDQASRIVAEELAPEPSEKPWIVLRFQLPDGQRFRRKFDVGTTLRQLRAFVTVELASRESKIERFNLFHASKRRTFSEEEGEQAATTTLSDVGLTADVLLVQDLDA